MANSERGWAETGDSATRGIAAKRLWKRDRCSGEKLYGEERRRVRDKWYRRRIESVQKAGAGVDAVPRRRVGSSVVMLVRDDVTAGRTLVIPVR
jgi:hypothetical protein